MDGGAWKAAVHGVDKSRTQPSDLPFTFQFYALEKDMATHSSVLAWRIPGTGSLVGCRLWGRKESDTTERFSLTTFLVFLDNLASPFMKGYHRYFS